MRALFRGFALLVLFAVCVQWLTAALARDLPILGGRGGNAFRDECPGPQHRLVGFRVRAATGSIKSPRCAANLIWSTKPLTQ
jgi:hypothetical protein